MTGGFGKKPSEDNSSEKSHVAKATQAHLKSFIDRIEKVEEQQAELAEFKRAIYAEASAAGFVPKIMRNVIKLRKLTADEREEIAALTDLYLAALGDLGGTPLGNAALKRLLEEDEAERKKSAEGGDAKAGKAKSQKTKKAAGGLPEPNIDGLEELIDDEPKGPSPEETKEAYDKGVDAHSAGKRITENPYPPFSSTRAAWEEGWMSSAGSSDGMDAPASLRRKDDQKQKKPAKGADHDDDTPDFMPPPGGSQGGDAGTGSHP